MPRYSRWRAGPNSLGPVARVAITLTLVAVGWLVFVAFRAVDGALVVADVGIYSAFAVWLLSHVWKRERIE